MFMSYDIFEKRLPIIHVKEPKIFDCMMCTTYDPFITNSINYIFINYIFC